MSWLDQTRGLSVRLEGKRLVELRHGQFQQLLRNHGLILDLMADAAEKQGGGFVLDRTYIEALADNLFNLTKAVLVDITLITEKRYLSLFDLLERFEWEAREAVAGRPADNNHESDQPPAEPSDDSLVPPGILGQTIANHPVLYRGTGQVAARGVASGPVFNLTEGGDREKPPSGAVWVAADLKQPVELSRVIGQVSAILTDKGDPASYICRLARSHHVPTIIALGDATVRLKNGEVITVDADDNVVYKGHISELLEYARGRRGGGPGEELEYQVLRRFRRQVFPFTISGPRNQQPGLDDVKTIRDLVHLALELGGEGLARLTARKRILRRAAVEIADAPCSILAIDLEGRQETNSPSDQISLSQLDSRPLLAFLSGLKDPGLNLDRPPKKGDEAVVIAAIRPLQANLIMPCANGFDMVDASISDTETDNHIYGRFDARLRGSDQGFVRRDAAFDILSRLDFAAIETNRAVTVHHRRLKRSEAETQLALLGRLWSFLKNKDRAGWRRDRMPEQIEAFMRHHTDAGE